MALVETLLTYHNTCGYCKQVVISVLTVKAVFRKSTRSVIFYCTNTRSFKNWTLALGDNGQIFKTTTMGERSALYRLEKTLKLSGSAEI